MFTEIINSTPFTTSIADKVFKNIVIERGGIDSSFISTLRALLATRIDGDEKVFYREEVCRPVLGDYAEDARKRQYLIDNILWNPRFIRETNSISLNMCSTDDTEFEKIYEILDTYFTRYHGNFEKLEKVTLFFRKSFKILCFVDREKHNVVLFTKLLPVPKYHYLQCGILAFMPWYFDPERGLSEDEMNLINSLRGKSKEDYIKCLDILATAYDFRGTNISNLLRGFESKYEEMQQYSVKGEIERIDNEIERYSTEITSLLKKRRYKETYLLGLKEKLASNDGSSEIMDYFMCNKSLTLIDVYEDTMEFYVTGRLQYFDEDVAMSVINNSRSYLYTRRERENGMSNSDISMLFKAIVDGDVYVRLCAYYTFSINGNINTDTYHNFGYECDGYLPNPHLNFYACFGDYRRLINDCLARNDYVMAIEQCVASCQSLNFADSIVMERFLSSILSSNAGAFFELPDGRTMTPLEAVQYLKTEESNE